MKLDDFVVFYTDEDIIMIPLDERQIDLLAWLDRHDLLVENLHWAKASELVESI